MTWEETLAEKRSLEAQLKQLTSVYQVELKMELARWKGVPYDRYFHWAVVDWEPIEKAYRKAQKKAMAALPEDYRGAPIDHPVYRKMMRYAKRTS